MTGLATGVLGASVAAVWLLSRTRLVGGFAVTGFVLGALAAMAVVVLFTGQN